MPLADAMKEPRRAKCRFPTEAEIALAAEEASEMPVDERIGEKGTVRSEGSGEPGEADEVEGRSARESDPHEEPEGEEQSPRMSALSPGKRLRSRTDGEESQRSRKLRRPRHSLLAKS